MATLSDVKEALEKLDNGSELYEAVVSAVDTAENKSKSDNLKMKQDVKTYSKYKDGMQKLGFDGTMELETFIDGITEKISNADKNVSVDESLKRQIEKERNERLDFQKKYEAEVDKGRKAKMKDKLLNGFKSENGEFKIYGADLVVQNLIDSGQVYLDESGDNVLFKDGESYLDMSEGIQKKVLDVRKDLVKNVQRAGAGSRSDTGDSGNAKLITNTEFMSKTPKERALYISDGGKVAD